jgi:hypothetical protein
MPKLASKLFQLPVSPPGSAIHQAPPTINEPSWLTGPALKAATEHLFATQRSKKAADRAKGKVAHGGGPSSSRNSSAMEKVWAEIWEASAQQQQQSDDGDWPELPMPPVAPPLRATQDRCEVPLMALVRPVKLRGAKAKETERTEFEFLPQVKNVIALDDAESNVPDEPWEYISSAGGDDEARKIFSYAEIVSKSA